MTQPLSSDWQVGSGGMTAPESYSIHTPHERLQTAPNSHPQEQGRPESLNEEPWDPWRRSAQVSAPTQRSFQEHGSQEDHRSRFSEKVAVMAAYQYDGDKGGAQWRLMIRQYLISRAPEMEIILQAVDAQEDRSAMAKELAPAVPILSPQLVQKLSRDLWGFLTLNLQGNARLLLNNSATLEGFELWRRLMKGIRSRSEIRRHELQGKLQRPEAAKSIADIPLTLEKLDSLPRE